MIKKTIIVLFFVFVLLIIFSLDLFRVKTKVDEKIPVVHEKEIVAENEKITILFLGDMMFDRGVESWLINKNLNPFEKMDFKSLDFSIPHDLVVGNLEGPITDQKTCQNKIYSFKFASSTAILLKNSGIDFVTIANNHSFDCFSDGLKDTRKYLKMAGIGFFGGSGIDQSFSTTTIKNKKIAFIGVDLTIPGIKIEDVYSLVTELKILNDYVILFMHWGNEYEKVPNKNQEFIGRKLVDFGADVVIGSHPHVTQTAEIYKNKPIIYSLGNFIFDQTDLENTKGDIAEIILSGDVIEYKLNPYTIYKGQPSF